MSCYVYNNNGEPKKITGKEWDAMVGTEELEVIDILKPLVAAKKETAEQQHIEFEDVEEVNGKKYPLLVMPSGLFIKTKRPTTSH